MVEEKKIAKSNRQIKLEEKLEESKAFDRNLADDANCRFFCGVDEVGRGCLAGPVVSAAIILKGDFSVLGVDDSKKLSEKKREELYPILIENSLGYGFGIVENQIIDEINILQATKLAMTMAIENCSKDFFFKTGESLELALIDSVKLDDLKIKSISFDKGDSKSLSVGAASIIAKVYRDNLMRKYAGEYPEYFFESNKGYGTKAHYKAIESFGITSIHRRSFLKNITYKVRF